MPPHDLLQSAPEADEARAGERIRQKAAWLLNRLRCMGPTEISRRVLRMVSVHVEGAGLGVREAVPPADLDCRPGSWVHDTARFDAVRYLAAADRIAAGRFDIFALHDTDLGAVPAWNRDPKSGIESPSGFGKLLDYRDEKLVGNIKYLWELNRHAHLVTLAQAYALSGDVKYFVVIREHLESWFAACPDRMGVNWASSLEAALRLINWSATWQLLGSAHSPLFRDQAGARLRSRWLESIYRHCAFIEGYFSRDSSANNHLIGEAAGLFIASRSWPHWRRSAAWSGIAKAILEKEAALQNFSDGVNREQAVSYQKFVLELLLLALVAGRANGQWFSVVYESRVEAMLEFLASIMDSGGHVPMIGDADDAVAVGLGLGDAWPYRSLLATGAVLFRRGDFKAKAGSLDDKTRWLFGANADTLFEKECTARANLPIRQDFPLGGYYILGTDFEKPTEIRAVVDAGPLGYEAIAAHGHADALAFTLSVGGMEFLIDPGTYSYHTQGAWRRYFRGTSAHNTVCVDEADQSQQGGNFMWLKKAQAGCTLWSSTVERDQFEGWQDGYQRLPDPVTHQRRITLEKASRRLVIEDRLQMAAEHDVSLMFHCSENCSVTPVAGGYALRQLDRELTLRLPSVAAASSDVVGGGMKPVLGWISRQFDDKRPSPTIAWRARLGGTTVLRSEIDC